MKKSVLILSILTLTLTACNKPKEEPATSTSASELTAIQPIESASETIVANGDTAELSLDWAGKYKGTIPCANCEGIQTELKLNSDKTYELTREYLGTKDSDKVKIQGTFSFDAKNPSIITLDSAEDHRKIFISENYLLLLNEEGDKITGPLADQYKLTKE